MRARLSALLLLVCLVAAVGAAQDRGTISGKVTDESGAVLPGVTITLSGPDKRSTITDAQGSFAFVGILPGEYQLIAELAGFTSMRQVVTLALGSSESRLIRLGIGSVTETVMVTAESVMVDASSSRAGRSKRYSSPAPPPTYQQLPGRFNPDFNTEAYDQIDDNPFRPGRRRSALDVLDRRRHRLVRQRPALPQRRHAAAAGRGADRGAAQLLPLRLPAADGRRRRSRSRPRSPAARGTPSIGWCASACKGREIARRRAARRATSCS